MWTLKRILVPTDFSKASEPALDAGITIAKKFEAAIVLLHVYRVPVYPYPTTSHANITTGELAKDIEQGALSALQTAASSRGDRGVPITTKLAAGVPWEQIIRSAKEVGAGLVVMGSRGLCGLPRALLGSTAERVVRYSPIPVLTFHEPLPVSEEEQSAVGARAANDLVERWLI